MKTYTQTHLKCDIFWQNKIRKAYASVPSVPHKSQYFHCCDVVTTQEKFFTGGKKVKYLNNFLKRTLVTPLELVDETPTNFFILKYAKEKFSIVSPVRCSYTFIEGINLLLPVQLQLVTTEKLLRRINTGYTSFCPAGHLRSREGKERRTHSACEARKESEKEKSKELVQNLLEKMCLL